MIVVFLDSDCNSELDFSIQGGIWILGNGKFKIQILLLSLNHGLIKLRTQIEILNSYLTIFELWFQFVWLWIYFQELFWDTNSTKSVKSLLKLNIAELILFFKPTSFVMIIWVWGVFSKSFFSGCKFEWKKEGLSTLMCNTL